MKKRVREKQKERERPSACSQTVSDAMSFKHSEEVKYLLWDCGGVIRLDGVDAGLPPQPGPRDPHTL